MILSYRYRQVEYNELHLVTQYIYMCYVYRYKTCRLFCFFVYKIIKKWAEIGGGSFDKTKLNFTEITGYKREGK
jgi:hypothetical protein